jgi:hypothetical protein
MAPQWTVKTLAHLIQSLLSITLDHVGQQLVSEGLQDFPINQSWPPDPIRPYFLKFGCRRFDEGKILMASRYLATVRRAIPID